MEEELSFQPEICSGHLIIIGVHRRRMAISASVHESMMGSRAGLANHRAMILGHYVCGARPFGGVSQ